MNENKAFTIVEIMIVLVIIGLISTLTYNITQSQANYFKTRYNSYSIFINLQNGISELLTAGCISNNITVCPKPGDTSLPIVGHDTNSPPLGLCDRLVPSSTNNGEYNVVGVVNCAINTSSDFKEANANFIIPNGTIFYNFGSNPDSVTNLYTVYVDMDGSSQGNSSTNTDILTFNIGLDGKVYPAYNTVAATNPAYISASSGYINSSGNYVGVHNGVGYQTAFCDVYGTYPPNNGCTKPDVCKTNSCIFSVNKPPGIK